MLRYDRSFGRSKRRLVITGWLPVVEDPLKVGPQRLAGCHALAEGTRNREPPRAPGRLFRLQGRSRRSSGSHPEPVSPLANSKVQASRSRQTYQVDDPAKLGELNWTSPPPRVTVLIESQLTIQPDSAEWVAIVRYDVLGGALDSIHLKVPTAWTANAQIETSGNTYHPKADPHGPITFWSINLDNPIWGTQRLVLRSHVSQSAGTELQHPEIIPLGRGEADIYLGLVMPRERG